MSGRKVGTPLFYLPYLLILALTLLLMAAAHVVRLPIPEAARMADTATVSINGGPEEAVTLPHRWPRIAGPVEATYRIAVDRPATGPGYLLIPAAQHTLTAALDGMRVPGTEIYIAGEPSVGAPYILDMPDGPKGTAELVVTLTRSSGLVPGYLSPVYAVDADAMADDRWAWVLVSRGTRVSFIGLQGIVILALATVWLARHKDPIFGWLFLIGIGSLCYSVLNAPDGGLIPADGQPYLTYMMPAFGLMALGLAKAIVGVPRPAWLKIGIIAMPLSLVAGMASGVLPPLPALLLATMVAIGGHVVAAAILARDALRRDEWDRALLALSILRIIQEAITNAVKHGTPGRITVQGSAGRGDTILLRIANEVRSGAVPGTGHGLKNMQRRAVELGGAVRFEVDGSRATLTVVLPSVLPDGAAP